jgi:two-component system, OmpR family, sensor histidine kinase KdpD
MDQEAVRRGSLKIFFGFAPGVGKTYRMLQVARELAAEGARVLVGAVETHGRPEAAALLRGLEVLPPRPGEQRGRPVHELDLDSALARKPGVVVLDELAHANPSGARHASRWQDANELRDAGIDVLTTLNVQDLESLKDVVARLTRLDVRQSVPDSVLESANQVELVDVAPEELLDRLEEGRVALPEGAPDAGRQLYDRGNLLALRELALRRIADRIDAEVRALRDEQGAGATLPVGERLLVCVGPAPASGRLVRAGRRMAAARRAPWIAAYVDTPASPPLRREDRERLEQHLRLAESLGASVVRLTGPRASEAILEHARRHNVTHILIGKPTHGRWRDLVRGSLLDRVVRGSGDIEVHAIPAGPDPDRPDQRRPLPLPRPVSSPERYLWATLFVALATGLAAAIRALVALPDTEMLYLVAVMLSALYLGRGPSLLAAGLSVLAYDFFFVPPTFTLRVADARYMLTFSVMFAVSLGLSSLAARIRRQEVDAQAREDRTRTLYWLTHELGAAKSDREIAAVAVRMASQVFVAKAWVLAAQKDAAPTLAAAYPLVGAVLDDRELAVARWVLAHGRPAGRGTDTLPEAPALAVPIIAAGSDPVAALVLRVEPAAALDADQRSFLESFTRQIALALSRADLDERARQADLRARTEEMRSGLLSAVSHDLRTPLASITGAATTLRDRAALDPGTRAELLATICEESDRLTRLVSNLLDMTRLESGTVEVDREWLPAEEVIGAALTRTEALLGDRPVNIEISPDLPQVNVDPVLVEQLLVNLLENAVKHTPAGSGVDVRATRADAGTGVNLEIADSGPGIAPGEEERIFERFYRGAGSRPPGAGLGLAICRAIARAHGATLRASNRPGGGAVFRLGLPVEGSPPAAGDRE